MILRILYLGYQNRAIFCSNWLRQKPDDAKLARAVLTMVERDLESETRKSLWGFRHFDHNTIIIHHAWKMYFEVSGVSKHNLGGMHAR